MSHDRRLVEMIKTHFGKKSSGQLQEITQGNDGDRWSKEAIEAAQEVLRERQYGNAQEPEFPE